MKAAFCVVKALLGLAVIVFSNGDGHLIAAGVGHILLTPLWWYAL